MSIHFSIPFHFIPGNFEDLLNGQQNAVLLETTKCDAEQHRTLLFTAPIEILQIFSLEEIPQLFDSIEKKVKQGFFLAGYLAYECGFHFENVLRNKTYDFPIVWFGVYREPLIFNHATGLWEGNIQQLSSQTNPGTRQYEVSKVQFAPSQEIYTDRIHTIKNHIREGDVYQINFTGRITFQLEGSTLAYYHSLKQKQRVPYSAFLQTEHGTCISMSPELFFRRHGNRMITQPMKGTAARGRTLDEDSVKANWLANDEKNRAENIMIVDVMRNDLGKISEIGSVHTSQLCSVEKYDTLFQMTSTVESRLRDGTRYYDIFKALFPSGSITGAPKRRTMQIINELESGTRGIYTGAIGYITPFNEAVFNVPIRTTVIRGHSGEMGVGGGITWDSDAGDEYRECEVKSRFFLQRHEEFTLFETLLWNNGFQFLEKHLERLAGSAAYFDFPCDAGIIRQRMEGLSEEFDAEKQYRVRLSLDRLGNVTIEKIEYTERMDEVPSVTIASIRTSSVDPFLYHKTSRRTLYDTSYNSAKENGFFEVLFMNELDQITEGSRSNVFIRKNNSYKTPPVTCGLLNGVYRQYMLETLDNVEEAVLTLQEVKEADAVFVCNALRGWKEVRVIFTPSPETQHAGYEREHIQ